MGGKPGNLILPLLAIGTGGIALKSMGLLGGSTAAGAASGAAGAGAAGAAGTAATAAGSSGLLGGITGTQAVRLGLLGGSTLLNNIAASNQITAQENVMKLQSARDALNLAEAEKESQRRLAQALGVQNNFYAATGTSASEGSALQAAEAAKKAGDQELSLYAAQRHLNQYRPRRTSKAAMNAKSLLNFSTGVYNILK